MLCDWEGSSPRVVWEKRILSVGWVSPWDSPPALPDLSLPSPRECFFFGSQYLEAYQNVEAPGLKVSTAESIQMQTNSHTKNIC